jgi:hypothetical protein
MWNFLAITALEYNLLMALKNSRLLPARPVVLELGENNWYDDVSLAQFLKDIQALDPAVQVPFVQEFHRIIDAQEEWGGFDMAKLFFKVFLNYESLDSIDLTGGTEAAQPLDLNYPIDLKKRFHITMNFGTGEHVFNVFQFFKTIHEVTFPSGLIFHGMPFQGWVDHGFFTFQPTFYYDLAKANNYTIYTLLYGELDPPKLLHIPDREFMTQMRVKGEIGANAMLYVVYAKPETDEPFKIPMQGFYEGTLSEESEKAWRLLR